MLRSLCILFNAVIILAATYQDAPPNAYVETPSSTLIKEGMDAFHAPSELSEINHQLSMILLNTSKFLSGRGKLVGRSLGIHGPNNSLAILASLTPAQAADLLATLNLPRFPSPSGMACDPEARYRSYDGSCNHLEHPCWGQGGQPVERKLWPMYDDTLTAPRTLSSRGVLLPNARAVSVAITSGLYQSYATEYEHLTQMLALWGQFITHDIVQTPTVPMNNTSGEECCKNPALPGCLPIIVDQNDPFFPPRKCLHFIRSSVHLFSPSGCLALKLGHPREQSNQVSAYLDASTIYGSSPGSNSGLRESKGQSARLRTDRLGGYSLLPRSEKNCTKSQLGCDQRCPLTGEKRASSYCAVAQVTPALTSLHTLWVREHNRLVGLLAGRGWTPEKLYQEVRRIISAMMQHITYTEFLPMIMGPEQMGLYQLNTPTKYDPSVRPQVINAFSAAAFRFGHSMVDRRFKRRSRPKMASPRLSQEFFSVHPWCGERLSLDPVGEILGGQSQQRCQKVDFYVTRELTNHLFAERLDAPGLDLLAIDIQRGRDHGLPPYTAWRMACGLDPINSYEDLALHAPSYAVERIKAVYGEENIHDVDLMVGGLAETPVTGALLGPTFSCLVGEQFQRLKVGDRFWYESLDHPGALSPDQIREIKKTTLAAVMCRNADLEILQPWVMRTPGRNNFLQRCSRMKKETDINLDYWQ